MSKRKKKTKKRKKKSSASLRGISGQDGTAPVYQELDAEWLVNEYQRRKSSETSLTIQIFADQYGVSVDELIAYAPELECELSVTLWHGTTKSRAESILEEGFISWRGAIYFAGGIKIPRAVAQAKASSEHDKPVLIRCSINLSDYSKYRKQSRGIYVFHHDCIDSEVIDGVVAAKSGRVRKKDGNTELTNVAITFNSGRSGIALWISNYLELNGADRVSEDHEAVGKIKEWLDAQADAGRFGEVSDEEMLIQVRTYLP